MIDEKYGFQDFVDGKHLLEKKKKKKSKKRKKRGGLADGWFTSGAPGGSSGMGDGGGGMGESLISELFAGITPSAFRDNMNSVSQFSNNSNDPDAGLTTLPQIDVPEEEPEIKANLVDQARQLFQTLVHHPDSNRASILNAFMDLGVTESTAVSYYTRFLDEFGMTSDDVGNPDAAGTGGGMGDDLEPQSMTPYGEPEPMADDAELDEPSDPNRAGFVRTVQNAHLVYKRQDENGSYEELWIYNLHNDSSDELEIRRDILAGTDIPPQKTKSPDGVQKYSTVTQGNAQMIHITGLPN